VQLNYWTFLDYIFALIIIISTGFALTKGLVREIVSLVALVGGFVLAVLYYPVIGGWFRDFARSESVAHLLGFLIIFLGCILLGAVIAFLINRFMKMASVEWVDRLLGGLYGFLRGWAVSAIIVLGLVAFPAREEALSRSYLAPYLLAGARAAELLVPKDLKDKFYSEYQKVIQNLNKSRNPS
jgi:membrane protein required for colicin V production